MSIDEGSTENELVLEPGAGPEDRGQLAEATKDLTMPETVYSEEPKRAALAALSRMGGDGIEPPTPCV